MSKPESQTAVGRDLALYDLVRHVAYAEQWIRHTESFDRAIAAMGMRWVWGVGLMQGDTLVPDPYQEQSP